MLELVDYNEAAATAEWKLADVRQNRSGILVQTRDCAALCFV